MTRGHALLLQRRYRMKKVAILLTTSPHNGGEYTYAVSLMEALCEKNDIEFSLLAICCNRHWAKWCKQNQIEYVFTYRENYTADELKFMKKSWIFNRLYSRWKSELRKIIVSRKIDLLLVNQQLIPIPNLPCKVITPVHDLMHRYEAQFSELRGQVEYRDLIFNDIALNSNIILVDSNLGAKQFKECYPRSVKGVKFEVLPFVVTDELEQCEEEYIDTPKRYVFYPAQFWEHKNHIRLIQAIEILKKRGLDVKLVLSGSKKNYYANVVQYIKEHGLEEDVDIKGFVTTGELKYLYSHALALVMPTFFGPTNIPPLEAMKLGCPPIVSGKYAMGEQVGDAGLTFDPTNPEDMANCIEKVCDPLVRNDLVQKGYQRQKEWTSLDFKEKIVNIVLRELR